MESTSQQQLAPLTDIQRFYKNDVVFLTGATGFIGKLLLEKILRSLPVEKVFLLVRAKKNVPIAKRMETIFESPIFDVIKRSDPDILNKVATMEGDCSLPMLGLSDNDLEIFVREVNVIFHCAATVRFDEHLRRATMTNIRATKDLVDLAKKIKKIKTFVYVGTAFSNSNRLEIKEEVYPAKIKAENLIRACETLDDECLTSMTKTMIGDWPNTYTFTKQVAEDYINRAGVGLPIAIARPSIVSSTASEPIAAFVDNQYTLAGFLMINGLGFSRISYYKNTNLPVIPADYVVNECIAIGWHVGEAFKRQKTDVAVFNLNGVPENPSYQDDLYSIIEHYARQVPVKSLNMFPLYFLTTCKYNYLFFRFIFHTCVAYSADLVLRICNKKPWFVDGIKKLHMFQEAYEYFTTHDFFMHVENTEKLLKKMSFQDKELFNFDMHSLNWFNYMATYSKGLRIYLLKEPMETLPEGIKRYNYLRRMLIVTLLFIAVFLYVIGKILLFRVVPFVFGIFALLLSNFVC